MYDQKALFRKTALEKLSSPERLDVLMTVTSPRGWIAMLTIATLLGGLIVWGVYGSIPTRVDGEGILIRGGTLREIRASSGGVLTSLSLTLNGTVKSRTQVGVIEQRSLDEGYQAEFTNYQLAVQRNSRDALEDQDRIRQTRDSIAKLELEASSLTQDLKAIEDDIVVLEERLKKGLITRRQVEDKERDARGLRTQIPQSRLQINSLRDDITSIEQRARERAGQLEEQRRRLGVKRGEVKSRTEIISMVDGHVVELKKSEGDILQPDDVIAVVEPESSTFEPVVYVDSALGKLITAEMDAQIMPSTVKREEFGYMKGKVRLVGDFPVTPQGVMAVIANQSLANELLEDGSKIEVRASLIENATTTSGFSWSSSNGPPFKIESGTRVAMSVVVERRRPYTYILPILKSAVGVS